MTTANNTSQCSKCQMPKQITISNEGCLEEFCQTDFKEHRQMLNEDLDVIINAYHQFGQTIMKHVENIQKHALMQQIDQWERNAIQRIQQTAENCRQTVLEEAKIVFREIEHKLSQFTEQIKNIQKEAEFNENDLNDLRSKLNKMNNEINNLSNIAIQEYRQEFINEISIISTNKTKFKEQPTIIAGGNGQGNGLNQLYWPYGIFVDEKKTIFIADSSNHRVVEWKCNAEQGHVIADGNGKGKRMDQLYHPSDMIVDRKNYSIIIADCGNRRVTRRSFDQKQEILIGNIGCRGLAMDQYGFLYVSDCEKHEVRKWKLEKINEERHGTLVAGGNKKGDELNQLNSPTYIFVDETQSLYVSDRENHRVMKWRKGASEGIVVAGGNSQGNNLNQLDGAEGLFVHQWGQIYVADWGNHRIMRWCEGDNKGEIVLGGNGQGNELNQLSCPIGLSFDFEGNLYVADCGNHRIVRLDPFDEN